MCCKCSPPTSSMHTELQLSPELQCGHLKYHRMTAYLHIKTVPNIGFSLEIFSRRCSMLSYIPLPLLSLLSTSKSERHDMTKPDSAIPFLHWVIFMCFRTQTLCIFHIYKTITNHQTVSTSCFRIWKKTHRWAIECLLWLTISCP